MTQIAFIGLGNMGGPMAENLLKAGHELKVYDINQNAVQRLAKLGATPCSSLEELRGSRAYITMLQNGAQVKQVCLDDANALIKDARKYALFIACSSIDVDTARLIHHETAEHGFGCVDAPVSGGTAAAKAGELTIMVGGETKAFKKAKPILEAMGSKIIHTGPAGTGQAAKICNNMILGVSMVAISEAFTLADKLGLAKEKLFEVSANASGQCWAMTSYCPVPGLVKNAPSNNNYQPGFTAQMMLKDLLLSQTASDSTGQKTELGKMATTFYQYFVDQGCGDLDFSGIIKMIEQNH